MEIGREIPMRNTFRTRRKKLMADCQLQVAEYNRLCERYSRLLDAEGYSTTTVDIMVAANLIRQGMENEFPKLGVKLSTPPGRTAYIDDAVSR
jgi:hypothetical protein